MLCAAQALDLTEREPWGIGTQAAYRAVRAHIPFLERDGPPLHQLIETARDLIRSGTLQEAVDAALVASAGRDTAQQIEEGGVG